MKIHYTPFISNDNTDYEFEIPESTFLNPIKLSNKIVSDVIPSTNAQKEEKQILNVNDQSLDLTWARRIKDTMHGQTIDWDEIKEKQMMAESSGNANAVSSAGAKGLYQIMDPTHQDYVKATGDNGDLFDPEYNTKVRDWYMDWLANTDIIKNSSNSEMEKAKNVLIAYNWGVGNLRKYLHGEKELPEETKKYIEKILPNA